ncbi:hypothetical protein JW865_04295 [Candidatus Bathyarchaeota archaeon]|nr:hypothetical protein [Candidatus Bathyarchaeota archaeon]
MSIEMLFLFSPFIVVLAGLLSERFNINNLRESVAILLSVFNVYSIYLIYNLVQNSSTKIILFTLGGYPPLGACFEIDMLGVFMAFSATFLGLLATIYSVSYMSHDTRKTEYYTLLNSLVIGMVGVAFAGDFLTFFGFWELMGIASYVLVAFRKESWGPIEAGFKYMVMGAVGSTLLLFGIGLVYGMAGTVNFAQISLVLKNQPFSYWIGLILIVFTVGFGVKSAIVPMHTWLPDAHPEAPSPISAMLSGILIEIGLFGLIRVLYLFFDSSLFMMPFAFLAIITMTVGNIMALRQDDLKRMLAYSSIAQIGYMLIGVSTGLEYGLLGTFLHIFNHLLMKGVAFLAAGNIIHQTGLRDINKLSGVGRMMPYTTISISIALLGLGGVPGTSGFISKFILLSSPLYSGLPILTLLGVLNATFSMAYYLRVIITLLSGKTVEGSEIKEAPLLMIIVPLLMSFLILVLGIFPEISIDYASKASKTLIEGLSNYIGVIF